MTRVLIIDDDRDAAKAVSRQLTSLNFKAGKVLYDVGYVASLDEGLRMAKDRTCDVVLMDLYYEHAHDPVTPEQTIRFMQEAKLPVPVLIVTGSGSDKLAYEAVKAGALGYLVKGDFDADALGEAIRRVLDRWALLTNMTGIIMALQHRPDMPPPPEDHHG